MSKALSRKQLISQLRKYTPRTMDRAIAYNARADDNPVNAVSFVSYWSVGSTRELDAIASALEGRSTWVNELAAAVQYQLFADKLSFFWHCRFRVVFPEHTQPLRLMDWEAMTETMAQAFLLDWRELASYQGYLAIAALNQSFHLASGYDERHRRGHAFMLRLFASWRGDGTGHRFPSWAHSVAVYERLLERWREGDNAELEKLLLEACDVHFEQSVRDKKNSYHDFGDDRIARVPLEILMVIRLREIMGLSVPSLEHPLMEAPFDRLPHEVPVPAPDEYMRGTMNRVTKDWPLFDAETAVETVKRLA